NGKANPVLVAALSDKHAVRRAAAAEALSKLPDQKDAVRKLLADPDAFVRLRVALALVHAREKGAVPVLIDTLPHLPIHQAWQAEDVLYRLAEGKSTPAGSLGSDEASRKKFRDAWQTWWKDHATSIDLAKLQQTTTQLGF